MVWYGIGTLLSLACLSHACQQNGINCGSTWIKVLETNVNGHEVTGSKAVLRQAVLSGSRIRISFGKYTTDTQSARAIRNEVCVEALFHISKNGWNKFQTNAYWWFLNVCTTGNVHMSRWYVGSHRSAGETKTKYNITWFVRHLGTDSNNQFPIYCNAQDGGLNCGTISHLVTAVQSGAEIHIVDPSSGYSTEFSHIAHSSDQKKVAGLHVWDISLKNVANYQEFQKDAYWWFTIWSSTGSRDMSRWSIGQHTARGHTKDTLQMDWFVDPCWSLAYEHDENGQAVDGSLSLLRSSALAGKRVRLVHGNNAVEANFLDVQSTHVTAQVLGQLSKGGLYSFQSNVYWFWQHFSTTGRIETVRYSVGSKESRGNSIGTGRVKWFIDARPWTHVYSHSTTGSHKHGSKQELINKVKNGKMVRFVVRYTTLPNTTFSVYNADNLAISPDGNDIAAQHIRSVSIKVENSAETVSFQSNPYWYFLIATTTGKIERSRWTVGSHEARGRDDITADIDWFTS